MDERFVGQIGTEKQHRLACMLGSRFGSLRDAIAAWRGWSSSKASKKYAAGMSVSEASEFIEWLKGNQ